MQNNPELRRARAFLSVRVKNYFVPESRSRAIDNNVIRVPSIPQELDRGSAVTAS